MSNISFFKKNKKITQIKNEIIVQHNNLVEARYRLSLQEKRLMLWLISQIQPDDEDFKMHTLGIQDFCQLIEVDPNSMYREIERVTLNLVQKGLSIRNIEEKSLIHVSWLSSAQYLYDEGIVNLRFDPNLQPFLLNLKEHFTKISLSDVMSLRSIYAVRIYELLKQYEPLKKREIPLSELRKYCGIDEIKYKNYNDFKRKVIDAAFKEIDEKTDITFNIKEVKRSRKIVSIIFYIKQNPQYTGDRSNDEQSIYAEAKKIRLEFEEKEQIIKRIMEYGFSKRNAQLMIEELTDFEAKEALKAVEVQISKGTVLNTKAMLRNAFKEKWKLDVFNAIPKK